MDSSETYIKKTTKLTIKQGARVYAGPEGGFAGSIEVLIDRMKLIVKDSEGGLKMYSKGHIYSTMAGQVMYLVEPIGWIRMDDVLWVADRAIPASPLYKG